MSITGGDRPWYNVLEALSTEPKAGGSVPEMLVLYKDNIFKEVKPDDAL